MNERSLQTPLSPRLPHHAKQISSLVVPRMDFIIRNINDTKEIIDTIMNEAVEIYPYLGENALYHSINQAFLLSSLSEEMRDESRVRWFKPYTGPDLSADIIEEITALIAENLIERTVW